MPTFKDIEAARRRIGESLFATPCARSEAFSQLCGCDMAFKLENLQMTGSFKERGALNRLLTLGQEERGRGVIAASAGNHGQALAYHAGRLGIGAKIVVPAGTPLTKVSAIKRFQGQVVLHGANYDEAYEEALRLAQAEGATLVHAFDDEEVIAGQGTVGLEILQERPFTEVVVVPIGGGGLVSGIAVAIKETNPKIRIVGVQTAALPSMRQSLTEGRVATLEPAVTIADGIAVKRPGQRTFPLVQRYVDEVVTVDDEEIAAGILLLLEREKTLAEGAGAAALAAVYHRKVELEGKRVVVLVSGGNIDMNFLSTIIERGLVQDGRRCQLSIRISDAPGSLGRLTTKLGELRASIVQITHERAVSHITLGQTEVEVILESRGHDHIQEILGALEAAGYEAHRA